MKPLIPIKTLGDIKNCKTVKTANRHRHKAIVFNRVNGRDYCFLMTEWFNYIAILFLM
jgi:hypothetical protein